MSFNEINASNFDYNSFPKIRVTESIALVIASNNIDVEIMVDSVSLQPFTNDEWHLQQEERISVVLLLLSMDPSMDELKFFLLSVKEGGLAFNDVKVGILV